MISSHNVMHSLQILCGGRPEAMSAETSSRRFPQNEQVEATAAGDAAGCGGSASIISRQRATHASQMNTSGPEISLPTSSRRFPQNEQWYSSTPSAQFAGAAVSSNRSTP